jgi:hypothetical protein
MSNLGWVGMQLGGEWGTEKWMGALMIQGNFWIFE